MACTQTHKRKSLSTTCTLHQIHLSVHITFIENLSNTKGAVGFSIQSDISSNVCKAVFIDHFIGWKVMSVLPTVQTTLKPFLLTNVQAQHFAFWCAEHADGEGELYEPVSTWGCCISCSVTGTVSVASLGMAVGRKQKTPCKHKSQMLTTR